MLNLDFSSPISGTVEDNNLAGTGFTSVQTNNSGNQYDQSRINLDPTAGTLTLTATQGSNAGATNTLKNALQVGIDATQTFTISTRLKGSPTNLTTAVQQGGLFFGSNQDNYAKLVVVNTGTNGLRIQLYREQNGVGSNVDVVTGLNWTTINTLDLFLTGDPITNKITAAYRVNSDRGARLTFNQSITPSQPANFFTDATKARAGILAFSGNAPDVPITFDSFGIAQDAKINFQPSGAAVPAGYIADNGNAYNATRGFGWVTQSSLSSSTHTPLNIAAYARDRNRANVDQRLDSVLHMQFPNTPAAAWEYAVPNGIYSVTVSVGDTPNSKGIYDSKHSIRVEGVTAINRFQATARQEYQLATVRVNVIDGRLTIDPGTGTNLGSNTKINYVDIVNITPGKHPTVSASSIASDPTGVYLDAAINVDVSLVGSGIGVDPATLNTTSVQLYRTKDNALIPGLINTSGGNDAIVYQPSANLDPNTNYTFKVTTGVRDESGSTFTPYSRTFNTGTNVTTPPAPVNFTKSVVYGSTTAPGDPMSSLTISPDGNNLYASTLDGKILRWNIEANTGNLTHLDTFNLGSGRAIIGLTFNPNDANELWISHNDPLFPQPATDFTGKISKLTLNPVTTAFDANLQDYVVGLPRSAKDQLSNSLAFGPNGKLYMTQGSNSAMGAPDNAWGNRPERLLTGAVLEIDPNRTTIPTGGFDVQTENQTNPQDNYNPYEPNAPVKIYATGTRNPYDLVWHSNGKLYVPTNGSAAGGNTPDDPMTTVNEALKGVGTQNDYLFKVEQGGYYGHPNPLRQEYIMNGGNPTSGVDPAEVAKVTDPNTGTVYPGYAVGTQPDPNYRGFAYDFGRNRSPNGIIEYKSNTFNGALKNKLLVVEYSGGNDILALETDLNGNIPRGKVTQVVSGLSDPLDLIEDTRKNIGNLYVAELINDGAAGRISLLRA